MKKTEWSTGTAPACVLAAAALWGMIGLWNRALMGYGLSPTFIVFMRNFGGMCLLCLLFLWKDRSMFQVKKEHLKYFFGTGIISVLLFTSCYFSCQKLASLAIASILLYTAPSFVVILSAILWKEPIGGKKILALVLTLLGCALVCGVFEGNLTITAIGVLLGIGAGFFYALYSIFSRYALNAGYSSLAVTLWTFLFAGMGSWVYFRPQEWSILVHQPKTLGIAAGLIVFSTVLPYLFYTAGLSKMESGKASIIASLEPVVAAIIGMLVFHESIALSGGFGILLVLAGVFILR